MSSKIESSSSKLDSLKWLVIVSLVAAGVIGNSYYADQSLLYRVIAMLVIAGLAGFIGFQTAKGAAFFIHMKEAKNEIRKVVWPTRQETGQTTMMVVAVVIIIGILLWGLDTFLGWVVSSVIG
ncbi:MAG: preprotein translocase subunit SecE [Pseudomonadales bacterium]|nr:preprotein translocase subunit SecE [Pseudomonadales bacterium]NRA18787.1 preprotein translocase subunit SecE [Oceanospirillaceae bacterium]